MHQLHDKTRKCDGKHMEIAGRGGAAEHIYIYMYMSDAAVIADSNSLIKYRWSGLRENLQ